MTAVVSFHLATFRTSALVSRLIGVPADRWDLEQTPGCTFGKVFGTSKVGTTRVSAELRRWAILATWSSNDALAGFVESSAVMRRWRKTTTEIRHFTLEPVASKGEWGGVNPFGSDFAAGADGRDVAVVTRAGIRWNRWLRFARSIGAVDQSLREQADCTLALGIGEWPIGEQATFSVWRSEDALQRFAYDSDAHSAVIKRTFQEDWFSEMLFARFAVVETSSETP